MEKLWPAKEAANLLNVSYWTLRRLTARGLPFYRIGRRLMFKQKDLDDWVKARRKIVQKHLELTNSIPTFIYEEKGVELAKAKFKTRINFGYGAAYIRRTKEGKPRFYLEYYNSEGKRKQELDKSVTNWEEAAEALRKTILQEHAKKYGIERKREKIGFKDFAKVYLEDYIMITRRNYDSDQYRLEILTKFFKDTELREITPLMIEKFRASRLKKGNSKSTVNRYLAVLKRMLNLAIGEGFLEENPAKKVRLYSEKDTLKERVLTEEEERRLLEVSPPQLKSILIIALNTGMRRGEILNLKWSQVDFRDRKIKVEKTKSDKIRYVNINSYLLEELLKLRNRNHKNPFVFFAQRRRNPLTTVRRPFKAACRKAKIEGLRFHDLRHSFGSRLIEKGIDIVTVQELLGHHSVTMTERYTHSSDKQKQKAVELLNEKPETGDEKGKICYTGVTRKKEGKPITSLFSIN